MQWIKILGIVISGAFLKTFFNRHGETTPSPSASAAEPTTQSTTAATGVVHSVLYLQRPVPPWHSTCRVCCLPEHIDMVSDL